MYCLNYAANECYFLKFSVFFKVSKKARPPGPSGATADYICVYIIINISVDMLTCVGRSPQWLAGRICVGHRYRGSADLARTAPPRAQLPGGSRWSTPPHSWPDCGMPATETTLTDTGRGIQLLSALQVDTTLPLSVVFLENNYKVGLSPIGRLKNYFDTQVLTLKSARKNNWSQ